MYKTTLNTITRHYIEYIHECIQYKSFRNYEMIKEICGCEIAGKNVDFYLNYTKDSTLKAGYSISALYYPTEYKVEIILKITKDFGSSYLTDLYLNLKAYLIHEVEHHLQNCKVPFREFLPPENYKSNLEYITAPSELEAFTKALYYIHRKTKKPFKYILMQESEAISTDKRNQLIFRQGIYNFIRRRKDLNIIQNINI
jgi:hypothetical protein